MNQKKIILLLIILGCNNNLNEWSNETQNNFRKDCQKIEGNTQKANNYCDCIIEKLMMEYNEETFKRESVEMLKNNMSDKFSNSLSSISEGCAD